MAKSSTKTSRPAVALTIQLSQKAAISPADAKKILIDAVNRIPATKFSKLARGQMTIIV